MITVVVVLGAVTKNQVLFTSFILVQVPGVFLPGLCYDLNISVWELSLEGRKGRKKEGKQKEL